LWHSSSKGQLAQRESNAAAPAVATSAAPVILVPDDPALTATAAAASAAFVVPIQELGRMSRPQMILALRKSADVEVRTQHEDVSEIEVRALA
jgi:hypothetical protein